jgi:predicted GIY-YIG superfamily endonuclease
MRRSKKPKLVAQYLENISSKGFEKHSDIVRKFVRGRIGIYALYRRGKLYYAGLASDLRGRLKSHSRDRHKQLWDTFSVYPHYWRSTFTRTRIADSPNGPATWKSAKAVKSADRRQQRDFSVERRLLAIRLPQPVRRLQHGACLAHAFPTTPHAIE